MDKKVIKLIKKFPPFFYILRFGYRQLDPLIFIKTLFYDPSFLKKNPFWYSQIKKTQLNKNIPLFLDRQEEIKIFFKQTNLDLLRYYLKYGFPNSSIFKKNLVNFFEKKKNSDELLNESYKESSFHYTLRLMLAYERYSLIMPYLNFLIKDKKKPIKNFKILDYGCGVSDIGLLFASMGAEVTIAELDDKKMEFTIWRFKKRDLSPHIIKIKELSEYPSLPKLEYDLIIATELFEHVRNPLKLLKNFTIALKSGGYLFDSMGGNFEREIIGDHLKEAIQIGNSEEYINYYNNHYVHISLKKDLNYLFKKIGKSS